MTRSQLFTNGKTFIRHTWRPEHENENLVITFSEMHANDPSADGFAERFLSAFEFDLITVQKNCEYWYQDLTIEEFYRVVKPIVSQYETCGSYGVSMGAYASLYFCGTVNANILAISPLVSIHPRYPSLGHFPFRKIVEFKHIDLSLVPKSSGKTVIIYDPRESRDDLYVKMELLNNFPEADFISAPFFGHPCAQAMQEAGILKNTVIDFLSGKQNFLRNDIRESRKKSSIYFRNLIKYLKKRHKKLSLFIYNEAVRLHPDSDRIRGLMDSEIDF